MKGAKRIMPSVAVGSEAPSYASVVVCVISFICGAALPSICTNTVRSVCVLSLVPLAIVGLSINLNLGMVSQTSLYACRCLLGILSLGAIFFVFAVDQMTRMHLRHRQQANPAALEIIQMGLQSKRIIRDVQYDIYLPKESDTTTNNTYRVGFFMLPGALLEHNVYASFLSKLSDAGILAVIQNCEPFRLATEFYGSDGRGVKALIEQIQERHGISAEKWSIGGHSLGGHTAMMIAKSCDFFHSLVMYGVNKSYDLEKTKIRVLAMTASNDGYQHSRTADISTFQNWGQGDTRGRQFYIVIEGGNHSGFGDYPAQTFPSDDGERTISVEEQHRQMVDATIKFLLTKQD